jgi:gamma-glutamyl:cysteine ligase YbdK (ATP-grasp superfamily)
MTSTIALQFDVTLVDPATGARRPEVAALLASLSAWWKVSPGLVRSAVRWTTPECGTLEALEVSVLEGLETLGAQASRLGLAPVLAAVHPSARAEAPWGLLPDAFLRPGRLSDWAAQRAMTSGVTIQVRPRDGVAGWSPGGLAVELPMLLALSASSPFWEGRHTGFASTRAAVLYGGGPEAGFLEWPEPLAERLMPGEVSRQSLGSLMTERPGGGLDLHVADLPSRPRDLVTLAAFARLLVELPLLLAGEEGALERNLWRAARAGHRAAFEVPGREGLVGLQGWLAERARGLGSPWRERLLGLAERGAATPMLLDAWRNGADPGRLVKLMRRDFPAPAATPAHA